MPQAELTTQGVTQTRRRARRRTRARQNTPIAGVRTGAGTGIGGGTNVPTVGGRDVAQLASYIRGCVGMFATANDLTEQQAYSSLKKHLPW